MKTATVKANDNGGSSNDWTFEVVAPMGGAAGEAFTNPLASSGMPPAAVLAREAIQNSVDAHADGENKISMRVRSKGVEGRRKIEVCKSFRANGDCRASERAQFCRTKLYCQTK